MPTLTELFDQAVRYHQSGQGAQAEALYRQILQTDPAHAQAHHLLGVLAQQTGRHDDAIALIRQAIGLDPGIADFHFNLGVVYKNQGKLTEAIDCYRQALAINPNHVGGHNNLGAALFRQGQLAEAAECYRQALRLDPNKAHTHTNLGIALYWQGQLAEAAECYRQALAIDPGNKIALWNRACLCLLQGDFERGWPDFEQRWALPGIVPRSFQQPRWDGSPLKGKTILVYAERGLGDTIMFRRYLPLVQQRGGKVIFECQPALVQLLAGISGVDQFVAAGSPLPSFDVQIPLLSLPGLFGTTLATIPSNKPLLAADPNLVHYWGKELEPLGGFKVGIAWQVTMTDKGDGRSVPLSCFEALARVENVRLVSLQKGPGTEQLASLSGKFPVLDLGERLDSKGAFLDTAAIMMNLDLVVTVDTAIEHVAGALGVPVWTLLQLIPDWRNMLQRSDSPWYPTVRLFRQRRLHDWGEVFERVAGEIRQQIGNKI